MVGGRAFGLPSKLTPRGENFLKKSLFKKVEKRTICRPDNYILKFVKFSIFLQCFFQHFPTRKVEIKVEIKSSKCQIFRFSDFQIFRFSDFQNFRFSDFQFFRFSDFQILTFSDFRISDFRFRISDFQSFRASG